MTEFEPIAIVGQGCLLPGCRDPAGLWEIVAGQRVMVGPCPAGRWRLDHARYLRAASGEHSVAPVRTDVGGYVTEAVPAETFAGLPGALDYLPTLDPVFTWTLYAARQALAEVRRGGGPAADARAGLILGNLSYPTRAFAQLYEHAALGSLLRDAPPHPANRFMSGLPALLTARALGLAGPAFALDAACASGLYAIKLACDRLADRTSDLMLAGGVNASDNLFIQAGFSTLGALSPSGRSRPFHREADGLVPSEGAAFVALKRLEDAERDGDAIAAVIRGIGLSNDGRSRGFLSPSESGQVRAIRAAFASSGGLSPPEINLIECHATGTAAGDGVEIRSLAQVYGGNRDLCLTALKANLGHSITTSAVGGLLKILGALKHHSLPATPNAFPVLPSLDGAPHRVLASPVAWGDSDRPRAAAISAFGMGGNNAHLLLEEWRPSTRRRPRAVKRPDPGHDVVIVGLGVRTHRTRDVPAFAEGLLFGAIAAPAADSDSDWVATFDPRRLASPPKDLRHALGQQLLLLETAEAALADRPAPDGAAAGVFVGMAADADINRHALRARLADRLQECGLNVGAAQLNAARAAIQEVMEPADVVGTMPNIPANRLNHQYDLRGLGFTVSAEEASGPVALGLAIAALREGALNTAIVGAVDLSRESCHEAAARALLPKSKWAGGDAAVVLVLKTVAEARRQGDRILARIDLAADPVGTDREDSLVPLIGHAHAASGLLEIAAAVVAAAQGARWDPVAARLQPRLSESASLVCRPPCGTWEASGKLPAFQLTGGPARSALMAAPRVSAFAGETIADLRRRMESGETGGSGPWRLAYAAASEPAARARRLAALDYLGRSDRETGPAPDGVHFFAGPVPGKLAFAFTGAAAAYPGMGRDILVGRPELLGGLEVLRDREAAAGWIYEAGCPRRADALLQLAGSSFLCQVHAQLTQRTLGLRPDAVLGLSSGETNAMFALGWWTDMDGLLAELKASELYTRHLGGEFRSVREHWGESPDRPIAWENWLVRSAAERVRAAVSAEPQCYLTIIQAPAECVIAGDRSACRRVLAALGSPSVTSLGHDIAVHCAAAKPFAATWRKIHTRPTATGPSVTVYSNFMDGAYEPNQAGVADALTGQALQTIDFPRIVERAWQDGVRIFVEHGPRSRLTTALDAILGERPHLAVALDRSGSSGLSQAANAAARLWAAGVAVDLARWNGTEETVPAKPIHDRLRFPLRRTPLDLPAQIGPVGGGSEPWLLPAAPALVTYSATLALAVRPRSEPPSGPNPRGRLPAPAAWHDEVWSAHRSYLGRQERLQRAFLDFQTRFTAQLIAAGIGGRSASGKPAEAAEPIRRPTTPDGLAAEWEVASPLIPTGPAWNRGQLEILAGGKIAEVFGTLFEAQAGYAVQVRLPEPPLLLCDRVTGIQGEAGGMGLGIVWTETDVRTDSWYLHHGRMPAGIFIEAGQADLLLISWLGADLLNRGERAYRLLGCELVFHDALPKPGEILRYQIHVDGHARQGDVRLFFFHYDCWIDGRVRISVRHGQAGFFSPAELAASGGVIWSPESALYASVSAGERPAALTAKRSFAAAEVAAFAAGDLAGCFGAEFERGVMHTRTPTIASGPANLIGEIAGFEPEGGPAGRGHLRAIRRMAADDWFFQGHFKGDPCMPGTLMAEGCLQVMAFYLTALGFTLERDGWRFEPVTESKYTFVCRGQATPASRELVYDLWVDECTVVEGRPTLVAHVLCTVDGLKAFKCERLALRLVRDYPLGRTSRSVVTAGDVPPVARLGDLPLDHASLLACAFGDPRDAFGPTFEPFVRHGRSPRLPGPPYHFCSRVARVDGAIGSMRVPAAVEMVYDIPPDAWYFAENSSPVIPFCVLLEIALQPCGWLASYVLDPAAAVWEPLYRNLDGAGMLRREIHPQDGAIVTRVRLTSLAAQGQQIILWFTLECTIRGETVYTCATSFGFFTPAALAETKGLPATAAETQAFSLPPNRARALSGERFPPEGGYLLPRGRLRRLDRLAGIWPDGGRSGLGYARAEKAVQMDDWAFKAHFFQDPVQPGSIGVESILQLLKLFVSETEALPPGATVQFDTVLFGEEAAWKYRGQVLPHHRLVTVDLDILERVPGPDGIAFAAEGRLWVDGKKIYQLPRIGTRLRLAAAPEAGSAPSLAGGDVRGLKAAFARRFGRQGEGLQDLLQAAAQQFVAAVVFADRPQFESLGGRPCLYLANHQVAVESMLFIALVDGLTGIPCRAIAKREHREGWMGAVNRLMRETFGRDPLLLFDRSDQKHLLEILGGFAAELPGCPCSLLAHVQGTRALRAGEPVTMVSSVLIDLALRCDLPIVPVRFAGGLPREAARARLEFPAGFGRQHYFIGRALSSDDLRALNLRERKERVCAAINDLGPPLEAETPGEPDPDFGARVVELGRRPGTSLPGAVLLAGLQKLEVRSAATELVLAVLAGKRPAADLGAHPEAERLARLFGRTAGDAG